MKKLQSLKEIERDHIAYVLDACDWNKTKTAKILGIDRVTLYTKIKRYNLSKREDSN